MKKKLKVIEVLILVVLLVGAVFLGLSIFTNINDALFLPLALGCIVVANAMQFVVQSKNMKRLKEEEKSHRENRSN